MNKLLFRNFNIEKVLMGGQAFNWQRVKDCYIGVTTNKLIKIKYDKEYIYWQTYPKHNDVKYISKYFDITTDHDNALDEICLDSIVNRSVDKNNKLIILNQDFDVCIISFILSQRKNIKAIRKSVILLTEKLGKQIIVDGRTYYLFPTLKDIANADIKVLLSCSLGYRAKYIKNSSRTLLDRGLHRKIHNMNLSDAKSELLNLNGVGMKVADCVLVFSLKHRNIFPLDVWGLKIASKLYSIDINGGYVRIQEYLHNRFKKNTSIAAQYLFEYYKESKYLRGI